MVRPPNHPKFDLDDVSLDMQARDYRREDYERYVSNGLSRGQLIFVDRRVCTSFSHLDML
jgi:hypothetical protein